MATSRSSAVLAIETSCDETAAAVVRRGRLLSSVVHSQVALHRAYSGVVPELASRSHLERLPGVVDEALRRAFGPDASVGGLKRAVGAVAFTQGPGLAGALLVGKVAAEALAESAGLPLIGVNHLEGHALALGLERPLKWPLLALVVSGGHTELVWAKRPGRYRVLGRTLDDAAGEVFDKVAKFLGLGYPGGPAVDRIAREGNPAAIAFPRPLLPGSWNFSFSGLKTAVLYRVRDAGYTRGEVRPAVPAGAVPRQFAADLCASFQEAVVDTLVEKTSAAARSLGARMVAVGGGVAANRRLREKFAAADLGGAKAYFPSMGLCADNAAMIAYVGSLRIAGRRLPKGRRVDPAMGIKSWA
ncbi:MAG TPA: tRNA (adenosine(37)-N6)-threonylcarbamoyltransferase complex transferase subunit TsaD [Elusimicrobiota bacterium]|nr:tRNA (adenosine(37)-N6)-threonylcarbamoyltransferase complex transferase subunit TsaD [Elusimicrobiota bacterium]